MSVTITPDIIDGMVKTIVERFDPLAVVLFGSCARGEFTRDSDVDLMVVMPDGTDQHVSTVAMLRALADADAAKDILVVTPSVLKRHRTTPGLIYKTILQEGKTLYERAS